MKKIVAYQTQDAKVFTSYRDAHKHAEKQYGDLLLSLANDLCRLDKYTDTAKYIDDNLKRFVDLAYLKRDLDVQDETED